MPPPAKQASARDLRHRILTCLNRLSDRDTLSLACTELESIIPTLTPDTFSLFISSVSSTTSADRSIVRVASLRLLSSLATTHRTSLSPHLSKLISAIIRRLRDSDSSVRTVSAAACSSFTANVASEPASLNAIIRPLADALCTEQESSAQSAAAMCLSAAVDAALPESQPGDQIVKMLGKWMRLLRSDSFKAKASLLTLIRSAIRVCEIRNSNLLRDMVGAVLVFLKSEDWGRRKAAAEALAELALVERNSLTEHKASCMKIVESRRFDKVKAVREAMNLMLDAWKEVPDVVNEKSPPPHSQASSKENISSYRRLPARSSRSPVSTITESNTRTNSKRNVPLRKVSPVSTDGALNTTARSLAAGGDHDSSRRGKRLGPPSTIRKLEFNKSADHSPAAISKLGSSSPVGPVWEGSQPVWEEELEQRRATSSGLVDGDDIGYRNGTCRYHHIPMNCEEDLSSIRQQLVQIDAQQSILMDLLQKFIGSSQVGMRSLETRVNGLELALDNISYDLAVSTTRMAKSEEAPIRDSCCLQFPGSDFLTPKLFWRRSQTSYRTNRLTIPANDTIKLKNRGRINHPVDSSIIRNPLAEVQVSTGSRGVSAITP